jgi:hypothetical protein
VVHNAPVASALVLRGEKAIGQGEQYSHAIVQRLEWAQRLEQGQWRKDESFSRYCLNARILTDRMTRNSHAIVLLI